MKYPVGYLLLLEWLHKYTRNQNPFSCSLSLSFLVARAERIRPLFEVASTDIDHPT